MRLISRSGRDHSKRFHDIAGALATLRPETFTLDGEVAVFDEQLVSRFEWLRHLNHGDLATPPLFMVFDLLQPAVAWRRPEEQFNLTAGLVHLCAKTAGGALRVVGGNAVCRSDERPTHLGREVVLTDSAGLVIGPADGSGAVLLKVGSFWTSATFSRAGNVQWYGNPGQLWYAALNCDGDAYFYVPSLPVDTHLTRVMTVGPFFRPTSQIRPLQQLR